LYTPCVLGSNKRELLKKKKKGSAMLAKSIKLEFLVN
jgi:hypothetical protein